MEIAGLQEMCWKSLGGKAMIVMLQNYFDRYQKMFSNWKVALFGSIFHVAWARNSHTVTITGLGDIINKTNSYNHDGSG